MTDRPAAPPLDFAEETLIDAEAATVPPPPPHQPAPGLPRLAFAATIVLIGFNLRPLYSSLGTLLPEVMAGTGLGPAGASMLTTLPVLCLGIFGPMAPHLARRFGTERAVLGLLLVLALGTGLRAIAEIPALAAGTLLAGLGIANLNVLLPGLIKRDFAAEAGVMSGFYVMALCGGAALAAGFTVPLARAREIVDLAFLDAQEIGDLPGRQKLRRGAVVRFVHMRSFVLRACLVEAAMHGDEIEFGVGRLDGAETFAHAGLRQLPTDDQQRVGIVVLAQFAHIGDFLLGRPERGFQVGGAVDGHEV